MLSILIVDDERFALEDAYDVVSKVLPKAVITTAGNYRMALDEADKQKFDIAFIDMEMPGMTGLELAKSLQQINPRINIIFVTAFDRYALDAYKIMASDYCLKPLMEADVRKAMENLRYTNKETEQAISVEGVARAVCFGEFELYNKKNEIVVFAREKTKELLAYLISENGKMVSTTQICDALWGESGDTKANYFWKITSELRKLLKDMNLEELFVQERGKYGVDMSMLQCDYYDYLSGTYSGKWNEQFMEQYGGWAEIVKAKLFNSVL